MAWLIAGLLVFFGIHLLPSFSNLRARLLRRLGEQRYQAVFSAVALIGLILIVTGMIRAPTQPVYAPAPWGTTAALVLMPVAMLLLAAANMPTNVKRLTPHPMLWGVVVWSAVHLSANGDLASVLLFGSFAVYAVVDMISASRRGVKVSTSRVSLAKDAKVLTAGLVAYVAFLYLHPYLFGARVLI